MIIELKIPSPGESVTEVEIAGWLVGDGDYVEKDQEIAEIESDKATLPLIAEESGVIRIMAEEGQVIEVGTVACAIDTGAEKSRPPSPEAKDTEARKESGSYKEPVEKPYKAGNKKEGSIPSGEKTLPEENTGIPAGASGEQKKPETGGTVTGEKDKKPASEPGAGVTEDTTTENQEARISPLAKKIMEAEGLSVEDIINGLRRITREDVEAVAEMKAQGYPSGEGRAAPRRDSDRKKMSMLRRNLSRRLVEVKNETAMLTTFNEADMSSVISIRKQYQQLFTEKHGVKLGFMSFFVKAVTGALKIYPNVNSYIENENIVSPHYHDIGIAVQTDKGLMVPVIRNTETLDFAEIEKKINELAGKARKNRISLDDLKGGTFTITNGGIFGSMLSTPILNPPQSGILGMHNIIERPVAIGGKVEIRPMMYIALSYDHRVIDGRDSVGFLVKVKELLENPLALISDGTDPVMQLLDI